MYKIDINELLYNIEKYAHENYIPIMQKESIKLLNEIIKEQNPAKILEIGTAIGYSAINILTNCNGKVYTIEINEDRIEIAKENFKKASLSNRVTIFQGDAKEILPMAAGEYDFILLDGPKGYYNRFLKDLLRLLKKDGILFCDNVYYKGMVLGKENKKHKSISINMREFISKLKSLSCLEVEFYDIGDGLAICKKIGEYTDD